MVLQKDVQTTKHLNRCSISLNACLYICVHAYTHKHTHTHTQAENKYWWGSEGVGSIVMCQRECRMIQLLCKRVWQFFRYWKIELLHDPGILLWGIPKGTEIRVLNICTLVFRAVIIRVTKIWEQPTCSFTGSWISKVWYTHRIQYYSVWRRKRSRNVLQHGWILRTFSFQKCHFCDF